MKNKECLMFDLTKVDINLTMSIVEISTEDNKIEFKLI